eukprot:jgi/Tetstr1/438249/TSEL_026818.t1
MTAAKEMRHWNPEAHIGDDGYVLVDVKAAVAEATAGTTGEQEMRRAWSLGDCQAAESASTFECDEAPARAAHIFPWRCRIFASPTRISAYGGMSSSLSPIKLRKKHFKKRALNSGREARTAACADISPQRRVVANLRNYLNRHYFPDVGKDVQAKKGPLTREDGLAKALDLAAAAWQESEQLGRYYEAGLKCPPSNVVYKGEKEVCQVTSQSEAAIPAFGGKPIVPRFQRSSAAPCPAAGNRIVALRLAGTAALLNLNGMVGVLRQQQNKAGGIIKHNTNAVENMAATQAFTRDIVDEGSSPKPPAKKSKQLPTKSAAEMPAHG